MIIYISSLDFYDFFGVHSKALYIYVLYIYISIIYHKYNYHSLGGGWQLCCFYLFLGGK